VSLSRFSTRRVRRRGLLGALAVLPFSTCLPVAGETSRPAVVIVFASGVEAYVEAVSGLRAGLAGLVPDPVIVDLKSSQNGAVLSDFLNAGKQRLIITVGTQALLTVASQKSEATIISTMIVRSDRPPGSQPAQAAQRQPTVYLDVPLASLMSQLAILLPGKNRFGIIHNSSREEPDPSLAAHAKQQGFTLHAASCSRPEDLVKTFLSLKGHADFVVVLPDSSLYNNTTVRPLILASLESRLPIVGFSSSFVRAGAALGVYPDFRDVGGQTADIVLKLIAGKTVVADESPRRLQVAVNQRVLRLLGLDSADTPGLVIFK
jgi:ABC-type uncharacterized transport system substrate-binding protein